MRRGLALRLAVVEPDARHAFARVSLDDDHGDAARPDGRERFADQPAAPDEHGGVDGRRHQRGRTRVGGLVAQQQETGAEAGHRLGQAVHHEDLDGVLERTGEVLLEDDPDDAGAAPAQRSGERIGPRVAERRRGRDHALARRVGHGCLPAEDDRRGRRRDARLAGDVGDGGAAHTSIVVLELPSLESIRYRVGMDTALSRSQIVAWRTAIFVIFFATGLGFATWASRVPSVKANLGINDFEVGLLLFASGAASIIGLSLANVILARWGARRGLLLGLAIFAVGIVLVGIGADPPRSFALTPPGSRSWGSAWDRPT